MSKTVKITLITGAIILCVGLLTVLTIGFAYGWDITKSQWESKSYESGENEQISNIDLSFSAGKLKIEFYDGDTIKVDYAENKYVTTKFKVTNETLKISSTIRWHLHFLSFNDMPETKVSIPQSMQLGLKLQINAGTVSVGEGTFNDINIEMSAGTISMSNVTCNKFDLNMSAGMMNISKIVSDSFNADLSAGTLKVTGLKCDDIDLDLSAGTIKLGIVGKKSDYTIKADVSAGSCNVGNLHGGSKRLSVDVSAGSVNITFDE